MNEGIGSGSYGDVRDSSTREIPVFAMIGASSEA